MANQEILEKAIQKAIEGGYDVQSGQRIVSLQDEWITYSSDHQKEYSEQAANLIFNHDFAKALWGEDPIIFLRVGVKGLTFETEPIVISSDEPIEVYRIAAQGDGKKAGVIEESWLRPWQYHLQRMVIADDPIQYLGESLKVGYNEAI